MKSPRHPRSAYDWFLHNARRGGCSEPEARRVASARMNARYSKHNTRIGVAKPARSQHRLSGSPSKPHVRVCKTQRERIRDAERLLERKIERSRLLMQQLMLAQKRGEDISSFVEEARSEGIEVDTGGVDTGGVDTAGVDTGGVEQKDKKGGNKKHPRAIKMCPDASIWRRLEFNTPHAPETASEPASMIASELQFHLEMGANLSASEYASEYMAEYAAEHFGWDLPASTIVESEGMRIEAFLHHELP